MIYLPLDKIMGQVVRGDAAKPATDASGLPSAAAPMVRVPPQMQVPSGANTLSRDRLSR